MRVDAPKLSGQIIEGKSIKQLPRTEIGDVIKAQVLSSSDSDVTLRLENGNTITASTVLPLDVQVGDNIELAIKDKQDGKLFLETLKNQETNIVNNRNIEQIKDLLNSFGISSSPKSISIISEMMSHQLSLTRENLQTVMSNVAKFSSLDIPKAVFMLANGVDFEEKNINLLKQYEEGSTVVGNQLKSIMDKIDDISDADTLKKIYQGFTKINTDKQTASVQKLVENVIKYASKAIENVTNQQEGQAEVPMKSQNELNVDYSQNSANKNAYLTEEQLPNIKEAIIQKIDNLIELDKSQNKQLFLDAAKDLKEFITKMTLPEFNAIIKEMPEGERKILIDKMTQTSSLDELITNIDKVPEDQNQRIEFLKTEIKKDLQKHFVKNTSEKLDKDLNITETYKDITAKLEIVKESISDKPGTSELKNLLNQTSDNINFMNNLSQYNSFIQIPLNIWGRETNGELFILKNSRKKIDSSNASAFLSLDMPNIGLTEVLVKVHGKNVDCNFRVENEKLVSLLKESSPKFVDALNSRGYKFITVNCGLAEKKSTLIDMEKETVKSTQGKNLSIDIKV